MPSIFPGMDPYLEAPATWPGLHQRLIVSIADSLQPQLQPDYYSEIGERLYVEVVPRYIVPDVSIHRRQHPETTSGSSPSAVADAPTVVEWEAKQKEPFVEIRVIGSNEVVTVIEVLSPTNKTPGARGRDEYLRKQREVIESDVHLVEIDLLRDGAATVYAPPALLLGRSHYDYAVCVSRGDRRGESEVYVSCLQERLPRISIPLRPPHKDVVLDLTSVFHLCYERGAYRGRIDYSHEPPLPALPAEDAAWLDSHLRSAGLRV
jgi:hypothetical protein